MEQLTKAQLLELAGVYGIELSTADKRSKHSLKEKLKASLLTLKILPPVKEKVPNPQELALQVRLRELDLREKELEFERESLQVRAREKKLEAKVVMRKLAVEVRSEGAAEVDGESFQVGRCIKLVPPFNERDVEKYFPHFERVAITLKWPENVWTLLL